MNKMRRAAWPFTTILLAVTWVMFPPAGWLWSRARRNARRHRQLVQAAQRPVVVQVPMSDPRYDATIRRTGGLPPCAAVHQHGPNCGYGR
jgi:hypothetical protein